LYFSILGVVYTIMLYILVSKVCLMCLNFIYIPSVLFVHTVSKLKTSVNVFTFYCVSWEFQVILPAVEYKVPGYILVSRRASLLVRRDVPVTIIFWTPFGHMKQLTLINITILDIIQCPVLFKNTTFGRLDSVSSFRGSLLRWAQ
jgi:hypothetical protein